MFANKIFGLGAVALLFSVATAACSGAPDATGDDSVSAASTEKKQDFFSCKADDDCVAVARVGCCSNGWREAVNVHEVDAYKASGPKVCNTVCPLYVVDDTRVAECNTGTNKCEMVAIDKIACGGFTRNPHKCPDGYECIWTMDKPVDAPGACARFDGDAGAPDAGDDDADVGNDAGAASDAGVACGNTTCAAGQVCCNPLDGICTAPGQFCAL